MANTIRAIPWDIYAFLDDSSNKRKSWSSFGPEKGFWDKPLRKLIPESFSWHCTRREGWSQIGTLRLQEWSTLICQCWHQVYLNQTVFPTFAYEFPVHIEVFARLNPFPIPSPVLIRDDTLGKIPCKVTQLVKCINRYFIPPLKEIIPAIIGPKLQELPNISNKSLEYFYVMLGHSIISSLVFLFISF